MPKNKNIIQLSCLTDRVPDAESKPMATGYTHWKPFHAGGLEQISAGPSGDQNEQAPSQLSGFWAWMGWAVGVCEGEGQWAPLAFYCVLGMCPAPGGKSSLGNDFHQNKRVLEGQYEYPFAFPVNEILSPFVPTGKCGLWTRQTELSLCSPKYFPAFKSRSMPRPKTSFPITSAQLNLILLGPPKMSLPLGRISRLFPICQPYSNHLWAAVVSVRPDFPCA